MLSILFQVALAGVFTNAQAKEEERFHFPMLNPAHRHMRLLLENAFRYVDPMHGIIDPASGYPVEGWNQEPERGLHLRSFTQLTAIGKWIELLSNIVAGHADNPYLSREAAMEKLSLAVRSLSEDQANPALASKGLLVNFLGLEGKTRKGPLIETVQKQAFIEKLGEKTGGAVWQALQEKGWITPERKGRTGRIQRNEKYGSAYFDGPLAPFGEEPLRSTVMDLLDQRTVLVIFGDNANLTASLAIGIGALLRPEVKDDPRVIAEREKMERFIEAQKPGYEHLFDEKTGTFAFGWDARTNTMVGWDDGRGNWVQGQMNYLINEFRGPLIFAVLRYGLPEVAIRNAGLKLKRYPFGNGQETHALAAWEGSLFQLLGLTLFMQENLNPGWKRSLENIVDAALDYSRSRGLPGFLSEAYSGNGTEYTGYIGIPELALTDRKLNTHSPSLYTFGAAYMVAPEEIEKFLGAHWQTISSLFTEHGPWEGYDTVSRQPIRFQTAAHTLSLILGGMGSGHENMGRYLRFKGLWNGLEKIYRAGNGVNLLSPATEIVPWSENRRSVEFKREQGSCRFRCRLAGTGGISFVVSEEGGTGLSNGTLRIRYESGSKLENVQIFFKRSQEDPLPPPAIPTEIMTRFKKTNGGDAKSEMVLPATPGLSGIKEVVLTFGRRGKETPVDLTINGFEFVPFGSALEPKE